MKLVGKGQYGKVFKAEHIQTKECVAIKYISFGSETASMMMVISREVKAMASLASMENNGYTVMLKDMFFANDAIPEQPETIHGLYMVMDYCQFSLNDAIYVSDEDLSKEQATVLTYNLLCALKYLHSANIIHRDLKPGNIMVNENLQV